jgi:hypothetical protein
MRLALAGDAVLGRGVAQELVKRPPRSLVAAEIAELMRTADLCVVNLECCISERGEPVQKAFNFRAAARRLCDAGPALVAGTSAHVFHGVEGRVLYDLGDFIDDYAVDPSLRNDHGLLFLVELEPDGPRRVEAVPIRLEYAHTRLARGDEADWIRRRFRKACWALGTEAREENGHLVVTKHEDGRAAARATHSSRSTPPGPPLRIEPPPSESGGRGGSPKYAARSRRDPA